jgi:hypothetical protein
MAEGGRTSVGVVHLSTARLGGDHVGAGHLVKGVARSRGEVEAATSNAGAGDGGGEGRLERRSDEVPEGVRSLHDRPGCQHHRYCQEQQRNEHDFSLSPRSGPPLIGRLFRTEGPSRYCSQGSRFGYMSILTTLVCC